MATHPHLPPELLLKVFANFSGLRNGLNNAALVSQSWVFLCRSISFRSIHLNPRKAPRFAELLRSPNSTIGPAVRSITILGYPGGPTKGNQWLVDLFDALKETGLDSLELTDLPWESSSPPDLYNALSALKGITTLSIVAITKADAPNQLLHIFNAYPALRTLQILGVRFPDEPADYRDVSPLPTSLQTFTLKQTEPTSGIRYIHTRTLANAPNLRNLTLHNLSPGCIETLNTVIQSHASTLIMLNLRFDPRLDFAEICTCFIYLFDPISQP